MGRRGTKPEATTVKILKGTFREDRDGDRADLSGEPLEKVPTAPKTLKREGKKRWKETATELVDMGILTTAHLPALELYAQAWDEKVDCESVLKKQSEYVVTESGYISPHPAINRRFKAIDLIRRFMLEFGLTPSSQAGLKIEKPRKAGVATRSRSGGNAG